MSVKLKITLFITILIIVSLGVTIGYLSYGKYKPALEEEVVSRLSVQLNYINKIMKPIITNNWKENDTVLLNAIAEMFKTNPELLYFVIAKKKKNRYYTHAVYRRNIILLKEKKRVEPIQSSTIEKIFRFKGGRWPIKLKENRHIITASLNYYTDVKKEFSTNSKQIDTYITSLSTLKASNINLLNTFYSVKKKRIKKSEKRKQIRMLNKRFNLNLYSYIKLKKKLKNFLRKHNNFLEKSDDIFSSLGNKIKISMDKILTVKDYNSAILEIINTKKRSRGSLTSIVSKKNKEIQKILKELKFIKLFYTKSFTKELRNFEFINEIKLLFPVGTKNEYSLYEEINLMKIYKPIKYFGATKGFFEIGVSENEIMSKIRPIINSSIKSSVYIILAGLLMGLLIALYMIFPIKKLEKGADEITKDLSYRIKMNRKDEFGKFAGTFNNLADQLTEELTKYEKLYQDATEDGLTKLMVRKYFMETLKSELSNAKKENRSTSLFMTDIDHFKKFNDTYGHQTGDIVLGEVAKVLRKNLRKNRVRNDIAGRYGGEEFVVLLPDTTEEEAMKAAERIRKEIEEMEVVSTDGKKLKVTISIGVATMDNSDIEPDALIERADKALYNSKETGRNKVSYG